MSPRYTLSAIVLAATAYAHADIPSYTLDDVVVTATRTPVSDIAAPYASEVHTQAMISASGATTLVDYLAQHTSLNIMPAYGNKFTPLLDMRGYGLSSGYENIVITLDGQRLNNIDGQPQLLGSIPLASIDRIEITPGSGSVMFGDGATAGSIQIYTKPYQGSAIGATAGNHGQLNSTISASLSKADFGLSASSDHQSQDGTSNPDITGHRDASSMDSQRGQVKFRPLDTLWLSLDGSTSRLNTRYVGYLTQAQFQADPAQNGGNTYTYQQFSTDQWRLGVAWDITPQTKFSASHNQENKLSNYISPYPYLANYDYTTDELAIIHNSNQLKLSAGVQRFNGTRIGSSDNTSKNNLGYFTQAEYRLDQLTLSLGARHEKVEYDYVPNTGTALHDSQQLSAWDIGTNYRINERTSVFANYNQAFQAPDIDRFFNFSGTFNAFIVPQTVKTITVGLNHAEGNHQLKLAVFRANLKNEIYYNPATWTNTNIDQSHKYGVELQDSWQVSAELNLHTRYTYTRAIIDQENDSAGAYNGKTLPGVPTHGINLGLNYHWTPRSTLNVTHMWRSSAYAANDFANTYTQKQAALQSTNLAYNYHYKNYEASAAIDNLFAHNNGLWIQNDVIYPVNFTRNYRIGLKVNF